MRRLAKGTALAVLLTPGAVTAQDISGAGFVIWGVQAERAEYRVSGDEDIAAFEGDAFAGTDKLKLRWEGAWEYSADEDAFEKLENTLVLQTPVSDFFDVKAGVRLDTPQGPNRWSGIVGLHGLAPQWFELDADLLLSETGDASFEFEAEYEALITQRIILTPSIEFDIGFADDDEIGLGQGLRKAELGARLSYDLIDRSVAPYIGVHYERLFGETASIAKSNGEDREGLFAVFGVRLMF